MKNMIVMAFFGAAMILSLSGCNKESEMDKAIKESKEMSRKTSGIDQEVPRAILTPDKPKNQPDDGGK